MVGLVLSTAREFDDTSVVSLEVGGLVDGAGKLGRVALAEAVANEVADRLEDARGGTQSCGQMLGVRTCYTRMTP